MFVCCWRMDNMIIAITGHRPNKLNNEYGLKGPCSSYCRAEIIKILEQEQPDQGTTGVALGIDTLYALILIDLGIPFTAAIPCLNQDRMWPQKSKDLYKSILDHKLCTPYYVDNGPYASWKMQKRNVWLVDNCDKLIAVWDKSSGGTGNCVKYAQQKNKEILYINPRGYTDSV